MKHIKSYKLFEDVEDDWDYFDEARGLTDKYKGLIKPSKKLVEMVSFWNYESDWGVYNPKKIITDELVDASWKAISKSKYFYRGIYEDEYSDIENIWNKQEYRSSSKYSIFESWSIYEDVAYDFISSSKRGLVLEIRSEDLKNHIIFVPDIVIANIDKKMFKSLDKKFRDYLTDYVYEGEVLVSMPIEATKMKKVNW